VGVLAVVILLVVAFLIGRAASGGDDDDEVAVGATTTSSAVGGPTTSAGGAPVTTAGPGTTAIPETTTEPAGTVMSAEGALLEQAPQPSVQSTEGPDSDCALLDDAGWTVGGCGLVEMAGGPRVWLTESRPSGPFKEWRAFVLHWSQGKGAWLTDLRLSTGDGIAEINVRTADLTADGKPEVVFGFHMTGSGSILAYDVVVDGPGDLAVVGAARGLSHGRATVETGKITDYEAKYPNNEPNCCPAFIQVAEVTYSGGEFRRVETHQDDPGTGPPPAPGDL